MATAKRPHSPSGRKPTALRTKPARQAGLPFLRFYHSAALRKKTLSVLDAVEAASDASAHRDAVADVVVELTNAGLEYYFMKPLERAKAGFVVQQSAKLGLAGARQVMGSAVRSIIGRMDQAQLLSVSSSIRELMV